MLLDTLLRQPMHTEQFLEKHELFVVYCNLGDNNRNRCLGLCNIICLWSTVEIWIATKIMTSSVINCSLLFKQFVLDRRFVEMKNQIQF